MNPLFTDICLKHVLKEPLDECHYYKVEYAVECEASPLNSPLQQRRNVNNKMSAVSGDNQIVAIVADQSPPVPPQRMSSIPHPQNMSIYMGHADYYFDEDFSVPLDANFNECFDRCHSDPNLNRSHLRESDLISSPLSSGDIDLEFSVNAGVGTTDSSMIRSRHKMLMNKDLKDLLNRTDPDFAFQWDHVEDNMTCWAQIKGSRESVKQQHNKACGDSITLLPTKPTGAADNNGWRAMKEAASQGFTTWGQLKRAAASSRASRKDNNPQYITSQIADPIKQMHGCVRSQSQPDFVRHQADMNRYSGTLLEIYMRAKQQKDTEDQQSVVLNRSTTGFFAPAVPVDKRRATISPCMLNNNNNSNTGYKKPDSMNNFGAQFPPAELHDWRRLTATGYRPLSLNYDVKKRPASSSSLGAGKINVTHIPPGTVQLTESAGPESLLNNLRKGHNPRSVMIDYPGLGIMSIPKVSRLTGSALLDNVNGVDLSFLRLAFDEETRKGTPTMPKKSLPRPPKQTRKNKRNGTVNNNNNNTNAKTTKQQQPSSKHSCVCEHCGHEKLQRLHIAGSTQNDALERSTSEPDLTHKIVHCRKVISTVARNSCDHLDSTTTEDNTSDYDLISSVSLSNARPKKSVSFSEQTSDQILSHNPAFKLVPRNWGLYGQDPAPMAEFRPSGTAHLNGTKPGDRGGNLSGSQRTDIDVRFAAMVNDVIKAVQETVAYFCHSSEANNFRLDEDTGAEKQPLLAVIAPLQVLLSDGLLSPTRALFTSKPRSRLWALIEESCRPGSCPAGVAYHVLCEAMNEAKALPSTATEKQRFRAFACACLKLKALPMWLNSLVASDSLLKRYYCDGAFLRQCKSTQRGLYADLMTHLEQLLAYTFCFDDATTSKRSSLHHQQATTAALLKARISSPVTSASVLAPNQLMPRRSSIVTTATSGSSTNTNSSPMHSSPFPGRPEQAAPTRSMLTAPPVPKSRIAPMSQRPLTIMTKASVVPSPVSSARFKSINPIILQQQNSNILGLRKLSEPPLPARNSDHHHHHQQQHLQNSFTRIVQSNNNNNSTSHKSKIGVPPPLPPHNQYGLSNGKLRSSLMTFRRSLSYEKDNTPPPPMYQQDAAQTTPPPVPAQRNSSGIPKPTATGAKR